MYEVAINVSGPRGCVEIKRSHRNPAAIFVHLDGRLAGEHKHYPRTEDGLYQAAVDIARCLEGVATGFPQRQIKEVSAMLAVYLDAAPVAGGVA